MFKDGLPRPETWWMGLIVFLIGVANLLICKAHFIGNRYRNDLAGMTRHALEDAINDWKAPYSFTASGKNLQIDNDRPTSIRREALKKNNLLGSDKSVGQQIYRALTLVPFGMMVLGIGVAVILRYQLLR
jgi:hypothetical protein